MIAAYVILALDIVNLYMFNAAFLIEALRLKGSITCLALVASFHTILCFGWKPIAGTQSRKKGVRTVLTLCLNVKLIGTIFAFTCHSVLFLCIFKLLLAFSSPIQVLVPTIITNGKKNLGIVSTISFMGAALVCGHLLEYTHGINYIYFIMVINTTISLILTKALPLVETTKKDKPQPSRSAFEEITSALKNVMDLSTSKTYWDIFLMKFLACLSFVIVDSFIVIIFINKGILGKNIGYLVMAMILSSTISSSYLVKINKKMYIEETGYRSMLHTSIVLILTLLTQGFTSNAWIFVLFCNIMYVCRSLLENSMTEFALTKVKNTDKQIVLGGFNTLNFLTELIAPIITSVALEYSGISSVYVVSAVLISVECYVAYLGNNVKSELKKKK